MENTGRVNMIKNEQPEMMNEPRCEVEERPYTKGELRELREYLEMLADMVIETYYQD